MQVKIVVSAALLALSANAAAIRPRDIKTFKFQVNDPTKGIYYLAANGAGTQDKSKALTCELTAGTKATPDVIKCDKKGLPTFRGDMTKLSGTTSGGSSGWSIDENDNISWSAVPDIKFSIGIGSANDVYAETCPHHWTTHGTAKAIWITPASK
ncbi:hypothetical protein V8F20_010362 [Naviculisporaceae sp. PSN 640]